MKRNIYLIIITVLTVICIVVGSAYNFYGIFSNVFPEKGFSVSGWNAVIDGECEVEDAKSIEASISVANIVFVRGDKFMVEYHCSEILQPEIKVQGDTLYITQKDTSIWHMGNLKGDITVTVPGNCKLENLTVQADVGDVTVDGYTAKVAEFFLDVGELEVENSQFEEATVSADVGEITLSDSVMNRLDVECDTGNAMVADVRFEDLTISADVGDVEVRTVDGLDGYRMDLSGDIGDIKVDGRRCGKEYYVSEGTSGSITISNSVGDIDIE